MLGVELPKDANGKVIPLDTEILYTKNGQVFQVGEFHYSTRVNRWFAYGHYEHLADLIEPQPIDGNTSDGYRTFNELYHHRAVLLSVIVKNFAARAWKSKLHADGTMYEGMSIVGIVPMQGGRTCARVGRAHARPSH